MKTIILAGGLGTRLSEETVVKPKPMVEIGGLPVLWHIMKIYSAFGYKQFAIALGYKGEMIKDYFLNYYYLRSDFTIDLGSGNIEINNGNKEAWKIHLLDTGLDTQTGGRVKRLKSWVGNETFMLTYGDAVANVNIKELMEFHKEHGKLATVTAVRPPSRFGGLRFDGDAVVEFEEKPQVGEGWINGGYFVLEPGVFDYIDAEETIWEREPLEKLAKDGQLRAYKHNGFWQCMDTLRDVRLLNKLWEQKNPPWKLW